VTSTLLGEAVPPASRKNAELRVAVELSSQFPEFHDARSQHGKVFRDALAGYLEELARHLGLPGDPVATVDELSDGADPYRVQIDATRCRVGRPVAVSPDLTPERLAAEVAGTVALNRELCVTSEIADRLRPSWEPHLSRALGRPLLDAQELETVLRELVHRCVGVGFPTLGEPADEEGAHEDRAGGAVSSEDVCEAVLCVRPVVPIRVFVGSDLASAVGPDPQPSELPYSSDVSLAVAGVVLRELFFDELGLLLPEVTFEVDPGLADGSFRIQINDLRFPPLQGLLEPESMVNAPPEALVEQGVVGRAGIHPTFRVETTVAELDAAGVSALSADGFATWGPQGHISLTLAREIRRNAGTLLDPRVLTYQLSALRDTYPALVEAVFRRFDEHRVAAVTRRLLDELISIRDLVGVLEGMLAVDGGVTVDQSRYRLVTPNAATVWTAPEQGAAASTPGADRHADCVRRHLRSQVTGAHMAGGSRLLTLTVDKRLEARARDIAAHPLDESERDRLHDAIWTAYEPFARAGTAVALLTNSEVRREVRRLLEQEIPALPVLSQDEVAPGTRTERVARVVWP
jgi:FHIPEP family